jgi:F0F1-type ATP synthase membrane subunit b/b'
MISFGLAGISLVPDGTMFLHIAIICVMVAVLNRTLFKPINEILHRREERIRGAGAGSAADLLQQVEDKTRHYENTLREERGKGYRRIETERNNAVVERNEKIGAVKVEIGNLLEAQKATIAAQVAESRTALQGEAVRIAEDIGARILGRAVKG